MLPVVRPAGSDSATFDNVLELLVLGGRSLPHAMMMMIPEAYADRDDLPEELKGFYAYHSCLIEPWDGPAAIAFCDGRVLGATLDRNGLRPGRWIETEDGWVILASEAGVLPQEAGNVVRKGRLRPGNIFLVDLERHRIVEDAEVKREVARRRPYGRWFAERTVHLDDLPDKAPSVPRTEPLRARQLAFGYSQEDLRVLLAPMAANAEEPVGSMGNDAALPVMSDMAPPLFSYFKQLFAQVTNPPIDPIREEIVMSVATGVGAEGNLLDETPEHAHQLVMSQPILRNHELEKLRQVDHHIFNAHTIDVTWRVEEGPKGMAPALERICQGAEDAIERGVNILILSDRNVGAERVAMPALLAVGAVHHHLVRRGTRLQAGLVLESGEPREVHHFATLLGYGVSAVNPYLMLETLHALARGARLPAEMSPEQAEGRVVKAIGKGLRKTISKMGISTIQSYCGAQIFEAVGLAPEVIDRHFAGTASRIGGIGADVLAEEALTRHRRGLSALRTTEAAALPRRRRGMPGGATASVTCGTPRRSPASSTRCASTARTPTTSTRGMANEEATRHSAIRGLLRFRVAEEPIPLEEVAARQGDRQALRDRRHVAWARSPPRRTRPSPSR